MQDNELEKSAIKESKRYRPGCVFIPAGESNPSY